jgi:hypothetical protein
MRLVSFLSIVGVFVLLYRFVSRETGDRLSALVATGLFAATFEIGGAWFDVGRVDSLFLFVLISAMYVLRYHPTLRGHVACGALVATAFLTKQSGVVMAAPVLLYACYRNWRHGLVAGGVAAVLAAAGILIVDAMNDGWFLFYGFQLPQTYSIERQRMIDFWTVDILPPLAVAWAVGLFHFFAPRPDSPRLFYGAMAAGIIAGAWVSRGNPGGYFNVLIPVYFVAALFLGLGVAAARSAFSALESTLRQRAETWLMGACVLQFALLAYNPIDHIPSRTDAGVGRDFVASLSRVEGDVWVPYHGYLATMAGKRQYAHWMSVSDILGSGIDSLSTPLQAQVDSAIAARRFSLIVLSNGTFADSPDLTAAYDSVGPAIEHPFRFWPLSGSRRRPVARYMPKPAAPPPADTTARATARTTARTATRTATRTTERPPADTTAGAAAGSAARR